jgi:tripartite-type tricarboxylate transporter receptor subunit TctC
MTTRRTVFAAAALLLLPAFAGAQEAYPTRAITMIVPFPPGGVADQTGRPLAAALEKVLKQPVAVSNRQGAGGAVGMAAAANAKPDGYTILTALSSISIIPEADKLFGRQPAYQMEQLEPIALIAADPTVLVVAADAPWQSIEELVADAKKRPGEITFSSSGIYGTLHMAMAMFATAAEIELKHVPFAGGGPALTALLGNHVQALASGPGPVMAQIEAGKLRPLASWGAKRLDSLPEVPTFQELGYKDVEFYIWAGLFVPAKTPEAATVKLREAVARGVEDPDFRATMEKLKTPIAYLDAPAFRDFWAADAKRLAAAVQKVGKVEAAK